MGNASQQQDIGNRNSRSKARKYRDRNEKIS